MIALGVLRKDGRKIVGDRDNHLNIDGATARRLANEFKDRKKEIQNKREILKGLEQKLKIYQGMESQHKSKEKEESPKDEISKVE